MFPTGSRKRARRVAAVPHHRRDLEETGRYVTHLQNQSTQSLNLMSYTGPTELEGGVDGPELKYIDTWLGAHLPAAGYTRLTLNSSHSATAGAFNSVDLGDEPYNRAGRIIYVYSLHVNWMLYKPTRDAAAGLTQLSHGRLYIVLDRHANGAYAAVTDIFTAANNGTLAFLNPANSERFKILMDVPFVHGMEGTYHDGTGGPYQPTYMRLIEFKHTFQEPLRCTFTGSGNGIADLGDVALYAFIYVDTTGFVGIGSNARLRFTD